DFFHASLDLPTSISEALRSAMAVRVGGALFGAPSCRLHPTVRGSRAAASRRLGRQRGARDARRFRPSRGAALRIYRARPGAASPGLAGYLGNLPKTWAAVVASRTGWPDQPSDDRAPPRSKRSDAPVAGDTPVAGHELLTSEEMARA